MVQRLLSSTILNLTTNAMRFTPEGGSVEVAPQPPTADGGGVEFLVGCGKAQHEGEARTLSDFAVDLQFGVHAFEQASHN